MKYVTTFQQKLDAMVARNDSLLCVGLDACVFHKALIDRTHDLVCAYKPNSAFYEARGAEGIRMLRKNCAYIRQAYPDIPVILDAKRGDIASTNEAYAHYAFEYVGADAVTLNPYVGREALRPFLDRREKGCIILCRTSNSGSSEFQEALYTTVAEHVAHEWNGNGNCMLVVGAPYPENLSIVRRIVGDMTLLVPGIGTQGGDIEKTIAAGRNSKGAGMIIAVSRAIHSAADPRAEAQRIRNEINYYRYS